MIARTHEKLLMHTPECIGIQAARLKTYQKKGGADNKKMQNKKCGDCVKQFFSTKPPAEQDGLMKGQQGHDPTQYAPPKLCEHGKGKFQSAKKEMHTGQQDQQEVKQADLSVPGGRAKDIFPVVYDCNDQSGQFHRQLHIHHHHDKNECRQICAGENFFYECRDFHAAEIFSEAGKCFRLPIPVIHVLAWEKSPRVINPVSRDMVT